MNEFALDCSMREIMVIGMVEIEYVLSSNVVPNRHILWSCIRFYITSMRAVNTNNQKSE